MTNNNQETLNIWFVEVKILVELIRALFSLKKTMLLYDDDRTYDNYTTMLLYDFEKNNRKIH